MRSKCQLGQLLDVREAGRDDAWTFFFRFHSSYWQSSFPHSVHFYSRVVSDDAGVYEPALPADMVEVSMFHGWQLKSALAVTASLVCAIIGGWDVLAQALVALIALDVAAGLARAFAEKRLNSSIMRKGLIRKSGYFVAIALAVLIDHALFQAQPAFRTLVLSYLCVNEALSVLEHLAAIGVPLPAQLRRALEKLRKDLDDESHPPSQSQS